VCLNTVGTPFFCTVFNQDFYVAEKVSDDAWNYDSKADAGTIGMGSGSPVWAIVNNPTTKVFDIYMNNFNSWTWADSTYVVNTTSSVMNLGSFSPEYLHDVHTSIAPFQGGSYLFKLKIFGFGKTDTTANTEFYTSILNDNVDVTKYGILADTVSLALNFRGLGLPAQSFNEFSSLLAVATKGESTCLSRRSGYCALSHPCEYYNAKGLWDYDFKIQFETNSDDMYMRVPLASFAANYEAEGGVCAIFVEYLKDNENNGKSIQLGSMFFQSIYAQYTMAGVNGVYVDLFINKHALASTYLGNDVVPTGDTVFVTPVAQVQPDTLTSSNGQPTFAATIAGITDVNPYFLLDFSSAHTIVWDTNCMSTGIGIYPAGPCSDAPLDMQMGFDGSPNGIKSTGTFSEASFGGYVASGTTYTSEVCFGDVNCKFIDVYSAESVSQNNWQYNNDGAFGIIGMGPGSFIWEGFVDPVTKTSVWSIELARKGFYNDYEMVGASTVQSNITFGSANDLPYAGMDSVYMTALSNYSYGLESLAFGEVYEDSNGADSSEFFYGLSTDYPVTFNTNFRGMGLPANVYSQFVTLLTFVTSGNLTCDNTVDGICALPGPCSDWTGLTDFDFKMTFMNEVENNYMRIPLSTFAEKVLIGGGDYKCNIHVNYLDSASSQSSQIILGGMFFQEFFGVFTNDYNAIATPDQAAQFYVGQSSIYASYIGNEVLPTGVNPFVPPSPAPTPAESTGLSAVWIVVICLIAACLLGFLAFLLYRYKVATANKGVRGSNVVYGTDGKVNASDANNSGISPEEK